MGDNFKDYWVRKLLFPKKVLIDEPGVITNCVMRKYGGVKSRQRMVFFFEDILVNLQKKSEIELGHKDVCEMWYEVGKDVGARYLLLSGIKKVPHFLFGIVFDYIFSGFYGGGQSFAKRFTFDIKNMEFLFEGSNNILCRKTANGHFSAGVVSGIISFVIGKNIEATTSCVCPGACRISVNKNNKEKYILSKTRLLPDFNYLKFNFPAHGLHERNAYSFNDMVKFNKIKLIQGKWTIEGEFLIPGEVGMLGIINDAFVKRGIGEVFDSGVVEGAEVLAKKLLMEENVNINFKKIAILFSALGMGTIKFKFKDKIEVRIKSPPYSKYGFNYIIFFLNGFVNVAVGRTMHLVSKKFDGHILLVSFS